MKDKANNSAADRDQTWIDQLLRLKSAVIQQKDAVRPTENMKGSHEYGRINDANAPKKSVAQRNTDKATVRIGPVSYTHLTLPMKLEV